MSSGNWHLNLDQPTRSQFPGGRHRPLRGTYDDLPPSARWHWNAKDTASVGAFMAVMQPLFVPMSYALDNVATSMMPKLPATLPLDPGFWVVLIGQTLAAGVIKGLCNLLRSHGSSLLKDLLAWLAIVFADFVRSSVFELFFGWLPWRRRRRRRDRDVSPDGVFPWPRPRPPKPRPRRRLLPWRRRRAR